jgi:6-phosphogluconolactonase (cycloisomerase 2 family)
LTYVDYLATNGASDACMSPNNQYLYLVTGYDDSVLAYSRDPGTGALTYIDEYIDGAGSIDGLELATAIEISPDGKNIYATGSAEDGVAVFSRDPSTGILTFLEAHFDGVSGVDGINNPRGVAVSPDGAHVYVASVDGDSLAVFARNPTTGALTWLGMVTDGIDGVAGLNGVKSVTTDPAGDHVYAGGTAVAVFERDSGTGLLTYVENHTLAFSEGIAIDHTGRLVFVTSTTGHSLSVFDRDPATGALTLSSSATDGEDGVGGMNLPTPVALDPMSGAVYVGCEDDTLAVFQVGLFGDGFETGDDSAW